MSETKSQNGEDFGEDGDQQVKLPYFWQLIENGGPNVEEQVLEALKSSKIGNEGEEEEEEEEGEDGAANIEKVPTFSNALKEVHPILNQTLLLWATQEGFVSIVELLTSKAQEANIIRDLIQVDETQLKIFEKWEQERERIRLLEEKLRLKAENPNAEEEEEEEQPEEEEGEDKVDFPTKVSREFGKESEPQGEEEPVLIPYEIKKVLEIGELGLYNGTYRPVSEEQLQAEEMEDEENRPLHTYKFIREGSGQTLYVNGDIYVGEYLNGEKNGVGTYIFASKVPKKVVKEDEDEEEEKKVDEPEPIAKYLSWYSGQWKDGKKEGSGIFFYPDGSRYVGEFLDNQRHGKGTYIYRSGDSFIGNWKNGIKDGEGVYKFANDKSQYNGVFNSGIFTTGQWRFANGTVYEGQYDNTGKPQGKGTFTFDSFGVHESGVFKDGRWYASGKIVSI